MLDLEVTLTSVFNSNKTLEFALGCPFCHCVSVLQRFDKSITDIEVWYSNENPLANDLVLNLSKDGIKLIFDSCSQRIKMIEVYDLDKLSLRYHGKMFNSPTVTPTIEQINQSFGATTPCKRVFDENRQGYAMNFRGLAFYFTPENAMAQPIYDEENGFQGSTLGVKVSKLQIYHGSNPKDAVAPEMPVGLYTGVPLLEKAEVRRSNSEFVSLDLTIKTLPPSVPGSDLAEFELLSRQLVFGLSCQEVASMLGAPAKVFYKSDDKMRIHSSKHDRIARSIRSDYIYNYFSLGIDLIFDGSSHKLKKIVLHTNYPGHYDFNIYTRCNFVLPLAVEMEPELRMANPYQADQLNVTPYTKWVDIEPYGAKPRPVAVTRLPTTNSANPFGSTVCYSIHDMIFEVMKNKHIGSIVIYQK